jgi:poly(A) polymerase
VAADSLAARDLQALRAVWYKHDDRIQPRAWLANLAILLLANDDVRGTHNVPTDLFAIATLWEPPLFPLAAADVMALGIPAGPRVGQLLTAIEHWWIENNFKPARDACLAELQRHAA